MGMIPMKHFWRASAWLHNNRHYKGTIYIIDNVIALSDPVESSGYSSGSSQGRSCSCAPLDEALRYISFLSLTAGPPHIVKNEFGEECIQVEQNISHPPGMSNGGLQNIQHPAVVGHPPPHGGPPHGGPPRGGPGPSTAGLNEFNRMMAHQQGESTSHQRFQPVQKWFCMWWSGVVDRLCGCYCHLVKIWLAAVARQNDMNGCAWQENWQNKRFAFSRQKDVNNTTPTI